MTKCKKCGNQYEPRLRNGIKLSAICMDCSMMKSTLMKQQIQSRRERLKSHTLTTSGKKKKKEKTPMQKAIEHADTLFAKAIKIRDGWRCRKTGSTKMPECSHIMSRTHKKVRWDMDNAFTLNNGIHRFWWHIHPIEAAEWAKQQMGEEAYYALYRRAMEPFKCTLAFVQQKIEELTRFIQSHEK